MKTCQAKPANHIFLFKIAFFVCMFLLQIMLANSIHHQQNINNKYELKLPTSINSVKNISINLGKRKIIYAKISLLIFIGINAPRHVLDFWKMFRLLRKKTIGRDICGGQDICDEPDFYPQR